MLIKTAAAVIILVVIIEFVFYTVSYVSNDGYELSENDLLNWCASDYYDRDFPRLYETLTLFDCYGERFDMYWEAVEGYNTYIEYVQWRMAEEKGVEGAAETAESRLSELKDKAENPEFEENRAIIEGLIDDADSFFSAE